MTRTKRPIAQVPGPTITLSGGHSLAEFSSFSVRAIRAFDVSKPVARCLRGPFLRSNGDRVPPMNLATPYHVPVNARAVYIYAKSAAGAAHDVHVPLVYAPGEHVVVPLTSATDEKRQDVARLARLLEEQTWVFAHTMPENPHHYTPRKAWRVDADFAWSVATIRRLGYRQKYRTYVETVHDANGFFYWTGYLPIESTFWINRKRLPIGATSSEVVDQTLTAADVRLLDIPTLPDGFAGLDQSITRCRFFQAGVSLFGWPVADLRPRLRTHEGLSPRPRSPK